ncbi:hypothetical protein E2I00_001587 [Balaenoptera physalus]|uniref:Lipase domain-containing protein n=1 Tax=Balaenoptera physalus TaxID=9770 RepID=A0A6A1QEW5_BALPH|nr:hypothetical protein E2I00_001587 [Balaenoptera physalus]
MTHKSHDLNMEPAKMMLIWSNSGIRKESWFEDSPLKPMGEEVNYERVGCFKDGIPWTGTLSRKMAEKINTRFLLYTRHNPEVHQEISAANYLTIQASHFGTDKITHITYLDGKQMAMAARHVFLKVEDVNCINLDWINGLLQNIHAVNNLCIVGAEVAYVIDVLVKIFGYSPYKVHLIGYSLGAHLAGEAGSRTPGLGRITGLDPTGPGFHNTPNEVRLDLSDANSVDVIHTNEVRFLFELGVGTINACGHLDFYPNGGKHMPGCEDLITPLFKFDLNIYKDAKYFLKYEDCCYKFINWKLFSQKCFPSLIATMPEVIAFMLKAFSIPMHLLLILGNCFHCRKEGCPTMGHFADRFHLKKMKPNRSYYFLNTGTLSPFARWRHKLSVKLDGNNVTQGSIFLRVGGTTEKTGDGTLKPGMTYTNLIDADINIGNIASIEFIWKELSFEHSQNKLGAEMVIDISGKYGYESAFCS